MSADPFNTLGFLFVKSRPKDLNEYTDFYYKDWDKKEVVAGLRFGVLPAGLILRSPIGQLVVVMHNQLYQLAPDLKIIKK
jgi:hypothetical protein